MTGYSPVPRGLNSLSQMVCALHANCMNREGSDLGKVRPVINYLELIPTELIIWIVFLVKDIFLVSDKRKKF